MWQGTITCIKPVGTGWNLNLFITVKVLTIAGQGGCKPTERHPGFTNKSMVEGFGCDVDGLNYGICFHQEACTWHHWWVVVKEPLAKVYKLVETYQELEYEVSYRGIKHNLKLTTLKPSEDLIGNTLFGNTTLPVVLVSEMSSKNEFSSMLLGMDSRLYEVDASDTDYPTSGRVGDIQLDEVGNISFDYSSVSCKGINGFSECSSSRPALEVLMSKKPPKVTDTLYENNKYIVTVKKISGGQGTILFGNVDLDSIKVKAPSCRLVVQYAYGCRSCNKNPYMIIAADTIKEYGVARIVSNCTLDVDYVSCSRAPQVIVSTDYEEYCSISVPTLNSTLDVAFNYEFTGELSLNRPIISSSEDVTSLMSSITTNPNFLDGISKSFMLYSGITMAIATVSRVFKRYLVIKASRKTVDEV